LCDISLNRSTRLLRAKEMDCTKDVENAYVSHYRFIITLLKMFSTNLLVCVIVSMAFILQIVQIVGQPRDRSHFVHETTCCVCTEAAGYVRYLYVTAIKTPADVDRIGFSSRRVDSLIYRQSCTDASFYWLRPACVSGWLPTSPTFTGHQRTIYWRRTWR
jgi:hypothetical protein